LVLLKRQRGELQIKNQREGYYKKYKIYHSVPYDAYYRTREEEGIEVIYHIVDADTMNKD